jgi:hypothetical protein
MQKAHIKVNFVDISVICCRHQSLANISIAFSIRYVLIFLLLASVLTCHMAGRDGALNLGGMCGPQHDLVFAGNNTET